MNQTFKSLINNVNVSKKELNISLKKE